jgi:hypothetical protein
MSTFELTDDYGIKALVKVKAPRTDIEQKLTRYAQNQVKVDMGRVKRFLTKTFGEDRVKVIFL